MCGIFGFVLGRGTAFSKEAWEGWVRRLLTLSEPRGQEASGMVVAIGGHLEVLKRPLRPRDFVVTRQFAELTARTAARATEAGPELTHPLVVIGHSRLVTHGAEVLGENNQPVVAGDVIGVHNGIVTNVDTILERHPTIQPKGELDSEVLFRLVAEHGATGLAGAVAQTLTETEGTVSLACLQAGRELALATNVGSLHYAHDAQRSCLVFTSERYSLQQFLAAGSWLGRGPARQLAAGTGFHLDLATGVAEVFDQASPPAAPARPESEPGRPLVTEHTTAAQHHRLTRCTTCILPNTYPFITFDDAGRCNYCQAHEPPRLAGAEALESELARHRRTDGRPDCIVAFSGGRDSSYGLHLLVRELGMHPVAFSYDWGMVTGIARRNQARMCGKLGVEHILRAADIRSKRRYMRKNILAWLERPHLGMVPLFMAGDKYFYQVARQLRRELDIPLVVFCAGNPLERTDFKGGFAGVRESAHGQRLFAFSLQNKVQIGLFYGLQYLRNPAYFNESFVDSIGSFFETFVARDDFLYLYHYLPWDEETIQRTLCDEYDWEVAPHTDNTWRIGDGYTTFINHIYYTLAGFSEFDVFRSQQVRAGMLTRDQALSLAARDNLADLTVLQEFAAQVGLNLEEVLVRIEAAPRLY